MQRNNTGFEPEIHSVLVTDQLESMSTFGHADNGEGVFIPAVVARAAQIKVGDTVIASLVPNNHSNNTPWFAMHVHGAGEEIATDTWLRMSDEAVLALLAEEPMTTQEIADELKVPRTLVHSRMNGLFRARKVVKSMVFDNPNKEAAPAAVLWGRTVEQFMGEEE
jgi:hypothetical protein